MNLLDGTYDGGGDGYDGDYAGEEIDHSDDGGEEVGPYDIDPFDRHYDEYPQQEDYSNDADDFESHQLSLDHDIDFGGDD